MLPKRYSVVSVSVYLFVITTWQVSRKNKGLERALRAPTPYFFVVNLRTFPSRVLLLRFDWLAVVHCNFSSYIAVTAVIIHTTWQVLYRADRQPIEWQAKRATHIQNLLRAERDRLRCSQPLGLVIASFRCEPNRLTTRRPVAPPTTYGEVP
jgi:hypothetical protein